MRWLFDLIIKALFGSAAQVFIDWRKTQEAEKVGRLEQAQATETQAAEKVNDAQTARDHVGDLTADDVRHIKAGTDPDFRD